MQRFTLERDRWYACEFIGDEFCGLTGYRYSPIKVINVEPGNNGARQLTLEFIHANYPAGVKSKAYSLQTIERGQHFLVARSLDHKPARLLQIHAIDIDWIKKRFSFNRPPESNADLHHWLDQNGF